MRGEGPTQVPQTLQNLVGGGYKIHRAALGLVCEEQGLREWPFLNSDLPDCPTVPGGNSQRINFCAPLASLLSYFIILLGLLYQEDLPKALCVLMCGPRIVEQWWS